MSLAYRIVTVQICLGVVVAAAVWLAVADSGLKSWSMLLGSLCIVLPSFGYAWLVRQEHRPGRMLTLAWAKIGVTVLLLTAVAGLVAPEPLWLVAGIALAYIGHGVGSFFLN